MFNIVYVLCKKNFFVPINFEFEFEFDNWVANGGGVSLTIVRG